MDTFSQHLVFATEIIDDYLPLPATIEDLTFTGFLILAVIAFMREWIVPGTREKKNDERMDKLEESMSKLADSVEKSLEINETLIEKMGR